MAAGKWKVYDHAKLALANGTMDLDSDSFKINLYASNSNVSVSLAVLEDIGNGTNQLSTAGGYTQDTKGASIVTSHIGGTTKVDEISNPVWTASGGGIRARLAVIYNDTTKQPLCVCFLDTAADVTATSGNTLTITQSTSGLFTISGADSD